MNKHFSVQPVPARGSAVHQTTTLKKGNLGVGSLKYSMRIPVRERMRGAKEKDKKPRKVRFACVFSLKAVTIAYVLGLQMNHMTPGSPRYAEGEPTNLIDASSPMQLYRTT